uniref:Uncharacterized protein n=1 Tax=Anguilla anguilla TaxID=7936 RepID=A0A0E9QT52_ANGAN
MLRLCILTLHSNLSIDFNKSSLQVYRVIGKVNQNIPYVVWGRNNIL